MGVLLVHARFFYEGTSLDGALSQVASAGEKGVSFFFMLSGAILAYNYRGTVQRGRFYLRRVARIVPVYLLAFAGMLVALIPHVHGLGFLTPRLVATNLLFLQGWSHDGAVLATPTTSWTLSCELLFYLLFPLLLPLLRRVPERAFPVALALLGAAAIAVPGVIAEATHSIYFLTPLTRLPEFALGVLIGLNLPRLLGSADGLVRRRAGTLLALSALAGIGVMLVLPDLPLWLRVTGLYVPVFALAIVAGAAADFGSATHLLARRGLVKLGLWSYAFYSLHVIAITLMLGVLHHPPHSLLVGLGGLALLIAGVWIVSALVYRLWEEPWRERITGRRPREAPVPAPAGPLPVPDVA